MTGPPVREDEQVGETKVRTVRINDELWTKAQDTAAAQGETLATVLRLCVNAYVADPSGTVAALANVRAGR